jgi:hypothetical protein
MFISNPNQKSVRQDEVIESVEAAPPRPVTRWLMVFWVIILIKCAVVGWIYSTATTPPPIGAAWVIIPTLIFAGLVSVILARRRV